MSFGGSTNAADEAYLDDQHAYDIEKWKLDWNEMTDAYTYQRESFDIAKWNSDNEIAYRQAAAVQEWEDKEKLRIFDYNNEIDAYNASAKAYKDQLDINDVAQQLAMNDSTRKYNEQLTEIGFQNQDLLMKLRFAQEGVPLKYRSTDIGFNFTAGEVDVALGQTQDEAIIARQKALDQKQLSQEQVKGKGVIATKQAADTTALEGKQTADDITLSAAQVRDEVGLSAKQVADEVLLNKQAANDEVSLSIKAAENEARLSGQELAQQLKRTKVDAAFKGQEQKIANLHEQGRIRNLGQSGRTANKNVQASLAMHAQANQALASLITDEESRHTLNLEKVAITLGSVRARGLSKLQLEKARGASKTRLNTLRGESMVTLDKERGKSKKSLTKAKGLSREALVDAQNRLEKSIDAATSDLNLKTSKAITESKLKSAERTGINRMTQAESQALLSYDTVAQEILQQTDQTAFGSGQISESLKSAGAQYRRSALQTDIDRFTADNEAENRLKVLPVEPPALSAPLKLPVPAVQAPARPVSWESYKKLKPIRGVAAKGPSGLSQMLGIAGSIFSLFPSDDRLKRTYNRVGTSPSGVPIYTFKYIQDGEHGPWYQGTSAQDLLAMGREDAVVQTETDGFYSVDYSKLDVEFQKVTAT